MVQNKYGIKNVTIKARAKCFCPLGNDWYTNKFDIEIGVADCIPDYIDVDKWIAENINGKSMIIEEAVSKVHQYIMDGYKPHSCSVCSHVDDAAHSPVTVSM